MSRRRPPKVEIIGDATLDAGYVTMSLGHLARRLKPARVE